ncbi:TsaE protein, required for threonylcarbamoyladenosine t(6)A37 formation in tRNA [Chitinispirillum alkaliphilum]|nr:TsaE protein, required for threonylcarbamoyladenosine t(6)A37 formation in tRNA [Chitinispirillum alkaliphilum]
MIKESKSAEETRKLGAALARKAAPGNVFALVGDLGCGKTEFVRGFVHELFPEAVVRSPTFSIVNSYGPSSFPLYHFDFYRLCDFSELDQIGFEEYVASEGVCLIEWADMFSDCLPPGTIIIEFLQTDLDKRTIKSDFDW